MTAIPADPPSDLTLALLDRPPRTGLGGAHLAEVISVEDPQSAGRVQLRLLAFDGVEGHDAPLWAQVAVPFAGAERGAFLLPDVGDHVIVVFIQGDARLPVVVGGVWHGAQPPPETLGGDRVDRWTFVGKGGTRVAIVEESGAEAKVEITTPNQASAVIADGSITLSVGGSTIVLDSAGVKIETGATVEVKGSQVKVEAGQVDVQSAMASFSGVVKCQTLQATSVIASSYTPGAGNMW